VKSEELDYGSEHDQQSQRHGGTPVGAPTRLTPEAHGQEHDGEEDAPHVHEDVPSRAATELGPLRASPSLVPTEALRFSVVGYHGWRMAGGVEDESWSTDTDQCAKANEGAARHEIEVPHSTAEAGTQQNGTAAENEVPAGRTE
jgi:hypothetical protein